MSYGLMNEYFLKPHAVVGRIYRSADYFAQHSYVSIRQHTSAYVSIRQHTSEFIVAPTTLRRILNVSIRPAYVSLRQHTSSIRQPTSAYVSIRQHTSAYVSLRQHTSAYVSIRQNLP
jgi:hypothetical protein